MKNIAGYLLKSFVIKLVLIFSIKSFFFKYKNFES